MSASNGIRMSYANIKTVPSRKVFQAVFEGPIEQMMHFMELFGAPNPHEETWAGMMPIAAPGVGPEPAILPPPANDADENAGHPARPLSQIAGMLCNVIAFRRWLEETGEITISGNEEAAAEVRRRCGVKSRSELDNNDIAARHFRNLRADYNNWISGRTE